MSTETGQPHLGGVDVAFGDRGLAVAGFVLDVGEGVAGGGVVGEGGVAEVVEGPELLLGTISDLASVEAATEFWPLRPKRAGA